MDSFGVTLYRMKNLIDNVCELFQEEQTNMMLVALRLGKLQVFAEHLKDEYESLNFDETE